MEQLFVKFTESGRGGPRAQAERAPGLWCGAHFESSKFLPGSGKSTPRARRPASESPRRSELLHIHGMPRAPEISVPGLWKIEKNVLAGLHGFEVADCGGF